MECISSNGRGSGWQEMGRQQDLGAPVARKFKFNFEVKGTSLNSDESDGVGRD
jgi:hypothetical protein